MFYTKSKVLLLNCKIVLIVFVLSFAGCFWKPVDGSSSPSSPANGPPRDADKYYTVALCQKLFSTNTITKNSEIGRAIRNPEYIEQQPSITTITTSRLDKVSFNTGSTTNISIVPSTSGFGCVDVPSTLQISTTSSSVSQDLQSFQMQLSAKTQGGCGDQMNIAGTEVSLVNSTGTSIFPLESSSALPPKLKQVKGIFPNLGTFSFTPEQITVLMQRLSPNPLGIYVFALVSLSGKNRTCGNEVSVVGVPIHIVNIF